MKNGDAVIPKRMCIPAAQTKKADLLARVTARFSIDNAQEKNTMTDIE